MNIKRMILLLVEEIIRQLDNENARVASEYSDQKAFNKREQEKIERRTLAPYEIKEPDRPPQVTVVDKDALVEELMKPFMALSKVHTEGDPGLPGVEVDVYRTPQERAQEEQDKAPEPREAVGVGVDSNAATGKETKRSRKSDD
jgi:hypothetical protein